jgi:hypothetical protein
MFHLGRTHEHYGDGLWGARNYVSIIEVKISGGLITRTKIVFVDVGEPWSNGGEDCRLIRWDDKQIKLLTTHPKAAHNKNVRQYLLDLDLKTLIPKHFKVLAPEFERLLDEAIAEKNYSIIARGCGMRILTQSSPARFVKVHGVQADELDKNTFKVINDTIARSGLKSLEEGAPVLRGSSAALHLPGGGEDFLLAMHIAVRSADMFPLGVCSWRSCKNTYNSNDNHVGALSDAYNKYQRFYWTIFVRLHAKDHNSKLKLVSATPFFLPPGRFSDDARITFVTGLTLTQDNKRVMLGYGEADLNCVVDFFPLKDVLDRLIPAEKFLALSRDSLFQKDLFERQRVVRIPEVPKGEVTCQRQVGLFSDNLGWNQHSRYSTVQLCVLGHWIVVFGRGSSAVQLFGTNSKSTWFALDEIFLEQSGWKDPQYYTTIRSVVLNNEVFVVGRGLKTVDVVSFCPLTHVWKHHGMDQEYMPAQQGWNLPEYSTFHAVALADQLYIVGRGGSGLYITKLDPSEKSTKRWASCLRNESFSN